MPHQRRVHPARAAGRKAGGARCARTRSKSRKKRWAILAQAILAQVACLLESCRKKPLVRCRSRSTNSFNSSRMSLFHHAHICGQTQNRILGLSNSVRRPCFAPLPSGIVNTVHFQTVTVPTFGAAVFIAHTSSAPDETQLHSFPSSPTAHDAPFQRMCGPRV